jgi:hypothetical protein
MNELIGLISVRNYNYGSILQAFAFQKILFEKEINNEIIFYEKKNDIKQLLRIFNYPLLKAKLNTVKRGLYCKKDKEVGMVMSARNSSFSKFVEKELVFSKKYIGRDELVSGAKKYKAFVLGSDQVWNPMNLGSDFYTMSFCPKGILKVTYASSFGVSQIPKYQRKRTVEYLSNIDEISVREDSGAKIVRNLTGREVPVVVDPTLLLDAQDWGRLIQDERLDKEPYIFAYFVGSSPEHRKAVKRLAKATGLKVIGIPFVDELVQEDRFMINKEHLDVGPREFVNLIRHADYVCTDSFHATVFSIQHQKNFFVFDRYKANDRASMNSRLSSILSKLSLEQRMVTLRGDILSWYEEKIDYSGVTGKLMTLRAESEGYLDKICEMINSTR